MLIGNSARESLSVLTSDSVVAKLIMFTVSHPYSDLVFGIVMHDRDNIIHSEECIASRGIYCMEQVHWLIFLRLYELLTGSLEEFCEPLGLLADIAE